MSLSFETIKKRMVAAGAIFPMPEAEVRLVRGVGPLTVEYLKQQGLVTPSLLSGLSNRAIKCLINMNISNKEEAVKAIRDCRIHPGMPRDFGKKTYQEVCQWAGVPTQPANWSVGDVWKTRHKHLFRVVEVNQEGVAMLEMIHPYKTRPMKQRLIPGDWTKLLPPLALNNLRTVHDGL